MTECNQSGFGFEACGSREIVARFDGGTISSDGGAFLLRQTDQRLNLLPRLAECFLDGRKQGQVEHSIQEMLSQRIYGLALGYETSTITSNCGTIHRPQMDEPGKYANLQAILTRPINWELIEQQYDELIKFATALRLGTADAESILRRFTKSNAQHPTYKALCELGKALKTVFLCDYLRLEPLRREIHEGLQVIENWNSANDFILYGKGGEFASNRLEDQEILMLSLHLLQVSLVYVNTLMIQQVLTEPMGSGRLTAVDLRALSPLKWQHVNPYGTFTLNMGERLPLAQ